MDGQRQPEIVMTGVVINQIANKSCFVSTTGEPQADVFVSGGVARAADICAGDTVEMKVVPNRRDNGMPWFAAYARRLGASLATLPIEDVAIITDVGIMAALHDGPATAEELAQEFGVDARTVYNRLLKLHTEGDVAKATIYARSAEAPSATLWGTSVAQIMGEEE